MANKAIEFKFRLILQLVDIKQSFNNTISVECRDDKYVDYFKGKGKIGGGSECHIPALKSKIAHQKLLI